MRIVGAVGRRIARGYRGLMSALPNPVLRDREVLLHHLGSRGVPAFLDGDPTKIRASVLSFVSSMRAGDYLYRYSPSVSVPTLYASVYACLLLSLCGEIDRLSEGDRDRWADYFDGFQEKDGLFRDPAARNDLYEVVDWWGARHLVVHLIAAYTALGRTPPVRFVYLDRFNGERGFSWLDDLRAAGDVDNKIMNVACALQYERDTRGDAVAARAVKTLEELLWERRDHETGVWHPVTTDAVALSRTVQFAYHLYAVFWYDDWRIQPAAQLIDLVLRTQNALGGFGVPLNSSACEDMDSIDLLCRLSRESDHRADEIRLALQRGLVWSFANQNDDGGFVFRRNEGMRYGHAALSSGRNESAMFPTWFRTLAIAYAWEALHGDGFWRFDRCPGYQYGPTHG